MSYTPDTTRSEEILVALKNNPKFKNANIKVQPINGSGDYQFTLKDKDRYNRYFEKEGVVKKTDDITILKQIS
jgi:hypothetical protein